VAETLTNSGNIETVDAHNRLLRVGLSRVSQGVYAIRADLFQSSLAIKRQLCDNYVMRSTRNVVEIENGGEMGRYSDPPLLILASLAEGPKHGHAMIEDIAWLCGTRLGPGTLYGAIARLEQQGWIEPLPSEERRRPYRITGEGLRLLRARLITLQQVTDIGLGRLGVI
jgi:DNA-binding MarR family transcriptional regulator